MAEDGTTPFTPQKIDVHELVELDGSGKIRVAGERAVLIDTIALGLLRRELLEELGAEPTRLLLTRFGFVQGWSLAEATRSEYRWDTAEERIRAAGRLHMCTGMFRIEPNDTGALSPGGARLTSCFEAEQHVAHLGRSDAGTCWFVCGLFSGYLSRVMGEDLFVLEDDCMGKGDACCRLLARTREGWGDARADALRFFRRERLEGWLDPSLHHVTETLDRIEEALRGEPRAVTGVREEVEDPKGIIARSPAMSHLLDLARRVAEVDSTVLITGESGTGKERIARFVHEASQRAAGPFIAVNCSAITETLLESELFGHARGAFTGAVQHRLGLFEAANGGTLLLDEIGEVSPGMQVKLLRSLQMREIRRVGENRERPVDVRVIAATNSDLHAEIDAGNFRMDLYFRLNVVELHMPALRERREDILPLARLLLAEAAVRLQREIGGLSPAAADQLVRYSWPGNVRELENAMERAVALALTSRVELEDLPKEVRPGVAAPPPPLVGPVKTLKEVEKDHILAVLKLNGSNQARTAEMLQIGTATLYRKLKRYGKLRSR